MTLQPVPARDGVIHPEVTPDKNDLNLYCSACEKTFYHKGHFRAHLRKTHKMVLVPATNQKTKIINPVVTLDVNDPNYYCCMRKEIFTKSKL
jgi:hypothetical protein